MVRALPTAASLRDSSLRRLQRLRSSAGSAGCFVLRRADSFGYRRSLRLRLARLSRAESARPSPGEALAERALELVEEPFGLAVGAVVGAVVELAQEAAAGAAALGAGPLEPAAGAAARRAGLGADELAENAPRHLLQPPGAVARRAGRDLASRFRAVAAAARTGHGCLERDLARHAVGGLDELDLHRCREVGTAGAATTTAGAEQRVVAEEGREEVGEVAEVDVFGLEAATPQPRM